MEIIRRVQSMKETARQTRARGLKIGFVPTMGALHEGHVSLVRRARELADVVVVSIFVNPSQFGPEEDFAKYPRDLTSDADTCIKAGVDFLFAPEAREIYPPGPPTIVEVLTLSDRIEGASRPGHFRGVATVVLKLLEIVRPDVAVFGQKDAQQAVVIQRMVSDLLLDAEIVVLPTVREDDGLALSSRNRNLSSEQRKAAVALPRCLEAAEKVVVDGKTAAAGIVDAARAVLDAEALLRLDYLELVDPVTLERVDSLGDEALLLVAVHCGEVRLIDNIMLRP